MCRLYGFRSNEPTRVECSLVLAQNALLLQSRMDERGVANRDGWGIAHYGPEGPFVQKRTNAAHDDLRFAKLAESVSSTTVVAHVRAATVGSVSIENTHPFEHGPWTFAHNGTVTGLDAVRPMLEARTRSEVSPRRKGSTDSEMVFEWLLARMPQFGLDPGKPARSVDAVADLLGYAVVRIAALSNLSGAAEPPKLNLLLTDGPHLAASRWGNTLHYVVREDLTDCAVCSRAHAKSDDRGYRAVVIASEPLTDEEWLEVPEASVIAVSDDLTVGLHDLLVPERAVL